MDIQTLYAIISINDGTDIEYVSYKVDVDLTSTEEESATQRALYNLGYMCADVLAYGYGDLESARQGLINLFFI
jgi:hypothetical protein